MEEWINCLCLQAEEKLHSNAIHESVKHLNTNIVINLSLTLYQDSLLDLNNQ